MADEKKQKMIWNFENTLSKEEQIKEVLIILIIL